MLWAYTISLLLLPAPGAMAIGHPLTPCEILLASPDELVPSGEHYRGLRRERGRHGGDVILAKRIVADPDRVRGALTGSPEAYHPIATSILGEETAAFFSFTSGDNEVRYACASEAHRATQAINALLSDPEVPLLIRYYNERDIREWLDSYHTQETSLPADTIPAHLFLKLVAIGLWFPISEKNHLFYHDSPIHGMTAFLPNRLLLLAQRQLREYFLFEDFLRERHPHLFETGRGLLLQEAIERMAFAFDAGSGNFLIHTADLARGASPDRSPLEDLRQMTWSGASPRRFLETVLELPAVPVGPAGAPQSPIDGDLMFDTRPMEDRQKIHDALREFISIREETEGFDDFEDIGWGSWEESPWKVDFDRKIHAVQAAVTEFEQSDPSPYFP